MTIKTAMLLAAGLGTRMRPLTNNRPKPLIEVAGRSLIDYTLDNLVAAGVERAVINVHYLADMMEEHLIKRTDVEVIISDEREELLETGGGVVKALPHLGKDPVFVCNTDAFWAPDNGETLTCMAHEYDPARMDFLLLLARIENSLGYHGAGDFYLDEDNVLVRRGVRKTAPYVFAGVYVMRPQLVENLKVEPFSANVYWNTAHTYKRLFGEVMSPFWMHVGDPAARDDAEAHLRAETS